MSEAVRFFRNPGGDQSKVELVTELTKTQQQAVDQVGKLNLKILEGAAAQLELEKLREGCPHDLFIDAPGFIYDMRSCALCGKGLGLI